MAPKILSLYRQCTANRSLTFYDIPEEQDVSYWEPLYKLALNCDHTGVDRNWLEVCVFNQVINWTIWGAWHLEGAIVFSLEKEITQEFLETDVEGLMVRDIALPYDRFYLHWGKIEELGNADGCFIFRTSDGFYLHLTLVEEDTDYEKPINWFQKPQSCVEFRLDEDWQLDYDFLYSKMKENIDSWEDKTTPTGSVLSGFTQKAAELIVTSYRDFQDYLLPIIRVVVNALLYLTSAPNDITSEWSDAPDELVQAWMATPPAKRKRITQELNKLGYRQIKFVGRKLTYPQAPSNSNNSRKMPMHRRRGHIRHQAFGEGRKERKIKWIRPTWVNKGDDETIVPQVYEVEG
jgi:hypothetical protein